MHRPRTLSKALEPKLGGQFPEWTAGPTQWTLIKVPRGGPGPTEPCRLARDPVLLGEGHTCRLAPFPLRRERERASPAPTPPGRWRRGPPRPPRSRTRSQRWPKSELRIQTTRCIATLQRWGYFGRAIILARELANYRGDALLFVFLGNHWYLFDKRKKE